MMMGVILIAQIVTAQVVSPSALPSAPVPPTIEHVRSSTLCTALRDNVAPALFGLIRNDKLVSVGRASLLNLGNLSEHGQLASSYGENGAHLTNPLGMAEGNSHLFDIGRSLEKNVETIERILADPARFSDHPQTDDEKRLAEIKSELLSVLAKQKLVVNAFSGTADTAMMEQFISQSPRIGGGDSFSDTGIAGPLGGGSPIDNQEMATSPAFRPLMAVYAQANSISIAHLSPYDRLAELIGGEQRAIDASEGSASISISGAAAQCAGSPH
jgi:hypothetical protein